MPSLHHTEQAGHGLRPHTARSNEMLGHKVEVGAESVRTPVAGGLPIANVVVATQAADDRTARSRGRRVGRSIHRRVAIPRAVLIVAAALAGIWGRVDASAVEHCDLLNFPAELLASNQLRGREALPGHWVAMGKFARASRE